MGHGSEKRKDSKTKLVIDCPMLQKDVLKEVPVIFAGSLSVEWKAWDPEGHEALFHQSNIN